MFSRGSNSDPAIGLPKPPGAANGLPPTIPSAPVATNGRASPFGAASVIGQSVIGTDLTILGEKITIISQNRLQIDGDVRGDVTGKQVVIGEEGSIIGTVCAEQIEVRGGVRGAIKAQNVMLHPTSVVEGDIFHQTLSISEGAQFDGRVRRAKDISEITPNLDVNSYPVSSSQTG
ncbi:polymer-forming cytoskeletal protein [Hyphomicrobium sp.]|uniref:bactofilin family protein n=1 Tax=Hyphomicrobium sp. TaxID=82 RepID=UPI002E343BC3|nr:polymer-forming cytoskeletal protein [Hyphomicrobium sp.]HEX2842452.1 polymer-forming cytoskeletal protein [Hyphomicrobium sp.]